MPPLQIVTGGDARFFDFLRGTVESVRACADDRTRLGVFDLGLTSEQRGWVERHADAVDTPEWHHAFPGRDHAPAWLRGLLARPFLREYFPNTDVYLWLDADAFVLDWGVVELFARGATGRGLAIHGCRVARRGRPDRPHARPGGRLRTPGASPRASSDLKACE